MLSHAFRRTADAAILVAGDGDYVPMVEEMKSVGILVVVMFFEHRNGGLNSNLRLAADHFVPIDRMFAAAWDDFVFKHLSTRRFVHKARGQPEISLVAKRESAADNPDGSSDPTHLQFEHAGNLYRIECGEVDLRRTENDRHVQDLHEKAIMEKAVVPWR